MLISRTEEVKKYFPSITINTKFERIEAYLLGVESEIIIPNLTQDVFDTLVGLYDTASKNVESIEEGNPKELIKIIQNIYTQFAMIEMAKFGEIQLSEGGVQVQASETHVPASQWRIRALSERLEEKGYKLLEKMLLFLETNSGDFNDWNGSSAFTINKSLIVNNITDFEKYVSLNNSRILFRAMFPIMNTVELRLSAILGIEFFTWIKNQVKAENPSINLLPLLPYLHIIIANLSVMEALDTMRFTISPKGLIVALTETGALNDTTQKEANTIAIEKRKSVCKQIADSNVINLLTYLNKTATASLYPEFFNSSKYKGVSQVVNINSSTNKNYKGF